MAIPDNQNHFHARFTFRALTLTLGKCGRGLVQPAGHFRARARANFESQFQSTPNLAIRRFIRNRDIPILNADELMEESEEYSRVSAGRRIYNSVLHPVAVKETDRAFFTLLSRSVVHPARNTVVFTAGGSASGKSSAIAAGVFPKNAEMIFDTTFSIPGRALAQVRLALSARRRVHIYYIHRDFAECVRAMLTRAMDPRNGRVVDIGRMAKTHSGSRQSVNLALREFAHRPEVSFGFYEADSRGLTPIPISRYAGLPAHDPARLRRKGEHLLDEIQRNRDQHWTGGTVPPSIIAAARSQPTRAGMESIVRGLKAVLRGHPAPEASGLMRALPPVCLES